MVDRNFQKLKNGLFRQGGLFRGGRSRQVSLYRKIFHLIIEQDATKIQNVGSVSLCIDLPAAVQVKPSGLCGNVGLVRND